jgi:tetratricopeptide (TPR) repeat protein
MPDIGNYTETATLVLGEACKYFVLLLFSVLAIRFWRRWTRSSAANKPNNLLLASATTVVAVAIGYFSMCQSLGKLYSHYGLEAFHAGRLPQALALFETSAKFWNAAEAIGEQGVCALLLGDPARGRQLIEKARTMRKGRSTTFEEFYGGLFYFTQGQASNAVPLLQAASTDPLYHWSVAKIFAVLELDAGHPENAAQQMKPFLETDVAEYDQAYIIASLKLAGGQTNEARALLEKFPVDGLSPAWKARFEKLSARLQK